MLTLTQSKGFTSISIALSHYLIKYGFNRARILKHLLQLWNNYRIQVVKYINIV